VRPESVIIQQRSATFKRAFLKPATAYLAVVGTDFQPARVGLKQALDGACSGNFMSGQEERK